MSQVLDTDRNVSLSKTSSRIRNCTSACTMSETPSRGRLVEGSSIAAGKKGTSAQVSLGAGAGRRNFAQHLLPKAFADTLGNRIRHGAAAEAIGQNASKATVGFRHGDTRQQLEADRIIVTIPFSVLRGIELDSSISQIKQMEHDKSESARKIPADKRVQMDARLHGKSFSRVRRQL
jgi:hypothetical protein